MAKSGQKRSLKDALKSHQSHTAAYHKVVRAQARRALAAKAPPKRKRPLPTTENNLPAKVHKEIKGPQFTIPFEEGDRILLLGEGNFSFALSLVTYHGVSPNNLLATTLDSESECYRKYPQDAEVVVRKLRHEGVLVLFEVDATKLDRSKEVNNALGGWNRIVFNFPHAGAGIKDQDRNILTNQHLLLGFLNSAAKLLSRGIPPKILRPKKRKGGDDEAESEDEETDVAKHQPLVGEQESSSVLEEFSGIAALRDEARPPSLYDTPAPDRQGVILVTLRDTLPYTLWDLPRLAKKPPPDPKQRSGVKPRYLQVRSYRFWPEAYPGYEHRRTRGSVASGEQKEEGMGGTGGICRTWEFILHPDHV